MRHPKLASILVATAFPLVSCGGGGGVASFQPPPVTPPPPPPPAEGFELVPAATTSQQFSVAGASHAMDGAPRLAAGDQLQVRYVASSDTYEIELPDTHDWIALSPKSEVEANGGGVTVTIQSLNQQYSTLLEWFSGSSLRGVEAVGVATTAGAMPVTGSASYDASVRGTTSESVGLVDRLVLGSMSLNFDFGKGTLSGSISTVLDPEWNGYDLGTMNFGETVYSTGSNQFSGEFATNLPGVNGFSGQFTGPHAEELIGNFAFPYLSPIDGHTYQADGAFVGTK